MLATHARPVMDVLQMKHRAICEIGATPRQTEECPSRLRTGRALNSGIQYEGGIFGLVDASRRVALSVPADEPPGALRSAPTC